MYCTCTAAEELVYGPDEMSSLHQLRLADARNIAAKLVVSSAMSDNPAIGPRTVSTPRRVGSTLMQALPRHVPPELHTVADEEVRWGWGGAAQVWVVCCWVK
jgi:ATP-dependent Zn protease